MTGIIPQYFDYSSEKYEALEWTAKHTRQDVPEVHTWEI